MAQTTVEVSELRARLGHYLAQVKSGDTLVIVERGKPVGRIVPVRPVAETRLREMIGAGLAAWSGHRFAPRAPTTLTQGERTVAELLLEDRR